MTDHQASEEGKAKSESFDQVAVLYDKYRPGYPVELIEDIIRLSGIPANGSILEIGSGTGQATLLFAQRGYKMLCLEPGGNLLDVAARKLAAYPRVRFVQARFEEWAGAEEEFDLVISAQAYHWVPETVRYAKTAAVLKPRGHLAAFWNVYPGTDSPLKREMDEVYRTRAPEFAKGEAPTQQFAESTGRALRESRYFGAVVVSKHPWSATYSTSEYLGLLNTYSDHLRLPEERRKALFDDIAAAIERHGGKLERPYMAVAYVAQKRTQR